jgi:hypothetical protein
MLQESPGAKKTDAAELLCMHCGSSYQWRPGEVQIERAGPYLLILLHNITRQAFAELTEGAETINEIDDLCMHSQTSLDIRVKW